MAWVIEAALESDKIKRVIVSTDDDEIAAVARDYGAETPFLRPMHLGQDDSTSIDVALHAVEWLHSVESHDPDYILLIQPTSPLLSTEDIKMIVHECVEHHRDNVISVCPSRVHPFALRQINGEGKIADIENISGISRRQDAPPAYIINGAMYLIRRELLLQKQALITPDAYAYVMPEERSLDIDAAWELHLADLILRNRSESQ